MMRLRFYHLFILCCLFLTSCEKHQVIVHNVTEREANEIVVLLASKGIGSEKAQAAGAGPIGGQSAEMMFTVAVKESKMTEAMAILNQNGFPRKRGTNLLELFAKQGLMTSDKEETIRYQAGLAEQIANTIRKIDGVLEADVQLSFPSQEAAPLGPGAAAAPRQRVTASVYVKHQGVLDDPNNQLVSKIKRLIAGSVNGLDVNDVTVISDRSRFAAIDLEVSKEMISPQMEKNNVKIWSIVMSKASAGRFRFFFFTLLIIAILFAVVLGWVVWKFYPILKRRGFKELLNPAPVKNNKGSPEEGKR